MTMTRASQSDVEVWLNTASGARWFRAMDLHGREKTKLVQAGRTFTLTTFERQLNQENVASPEQDLFRNGTFTLKKPSDETVVEEIRSPNAMTNAEVNEMVTELIHGSRTPEEILKFVNSPVTLGRILEVLVVEDAPSKVIKVVKDMGAATPKMEPTRTRVEAEPVMTKPEADEPVVPDEPVDEFDQIEGQAVEANLD